MKTIQTPKKQNMKRRFCFNSGDSNQCKKRRVEKTQCAIVQHDILFHITEFLKVEEILELKNVSSDWNLFVCNSPMFQRRMIARMVGVNTSDLKNDEKELSAILNYIVSSIHTTNRAPKLKDMKLNNLLVGAIEDLKLSIPNSKIYTRCDDGKHVNGVVILMHDKQNKIAKVFKIDAVVAKSKARCWYNPAKYEKTIESVHFMINNIRWMNYNARSKHITFKHQSLIEAMNVLCDRLKIEDMFKLAFCICTITNVVKIESYSWEQLKNVIESRHTLVYGNVKMLNRKWITLEEYRKQIDCTKLLIA